MFIFHLYTFIKYFTVLTRSFANVLLYDYFSYGFPKKTILMQTIIYTLSTLRRKRNEIAESCTFLLRKKCLLKEDVISSFYTNITTCKNVANCDDKVMCFHTMFWIITRTNINRHTARETFMKQCLYNILFRPFKPSKVC